MKRSGYALFVLGQVGVIVLTRYFFQWVVRFSEGFRLPAPGQTAVVGQVHPVLFSTAVVGAVFLCFRIFDAVIDPFMGALADGWARSGRERRSLLWVALAWAPLGLILVFAPTLDMSVGLRWTLLLSGMFLFFAGYSFYSIPLWSLLDDYAQGDPVVRTRLSNGLGVGLLVATGLGFVLSPFVIARFGFFVGAISFALVGLVLMCLPYFAAPPGLRAEPVVGNGELDVRPFRGVGVVLRDRRFLKTILLFAGAQMSLTIMTAAAPYIVERLLLGKLSQVALLLGPFLVSSLVTLIFLPKWVRRYGVEKVTLVGATALGVAYGGTALLGGAWVGSPLVTAMIVFALAGPGAGVMVGLQGESIARAAATSEERVTGSYFGVFNLVIQALNGVAVALTGWMAELGRESVAPIRAMPVLAGVLCVLGVAVFVALGRGSERDVIPPARQ